MNVELISEECVVKDGYTEYLIRKEESRKSEQEEIHRLEKEISDSIKLENIENPKEFICPICDRKIPRSGYLSTAFVDNQWAEYAANLVTHYRHDHIRYYDLSWKNWRYRDKNREYNRLDSHEDYKELVNNRAKRQMIRAIAKKFSKDAATGLISGFLKLQLNDKKTVELIDKTLKKLTN